MLRTADGTMPFAAGKNRVSLLDWGSPTGPVPACSGRGCGPDNVAADARTQRSLLDGHRFRFMWSAFRSASRQSDWLWVALDSAGMPESRRRGRPGRTVRSLLTDRAQMHWQWITAVRAGSAKTE